MKIVSPDITHKSDIGGVKVGVAAADVYDAYEDIVARARNYQPTRRSPASRYRNCSTSTRRPRPSSA